MTGAQISVSLTYINANRRRAAAPALAFDLAAAPGKKFLSQPPFYVAGARRRRGRTHELDWRMSAAGQEFLLLVKNSCC